MEISRVLKPRAHGGGPPKTPKKILENPSQLDEMPHIVLALLGSIMTHDP